MSTGAAALAVAQLGWPVFRVRPRDKRPMVAGWRGEATTDHARVAGQWGLSSSANIGLATGITAWALDVDGDQGRATLDELQGRHGQLPQTVTSVTGSGGAHMLFAMPTGRTIRNSCRRLGPGLDTRGVGGFIVLPPSVHPNGRRYAWAPRCSPWAVPLAEAPPWLLHLVDPPSPPRLPAPQVTVSDAYARAALARAVERVAAAPDGARNDTLNAEAYGLARLVGTGALDVATLAAALAAAGLAAGLRQHEIQTTLASALRARLGSGGR